MNDWGAKRTLAVIGPMGPGLTVANRTPPGRPDRTVQLDDVFTIGFDED